MLNRYSVVHDLLEQLRFEGTTKNVFGERFNGDRRYRVNVRCGCGNCGRDEYIVTIGGYEVSVTVSRVRNENVDYPWYKPIEFSVALTDGRCNPIESTRMTCMVF